MATVLHHQPPHPHPHPYHQHQLLHQNHTQDYSHIPPHFCKDCGVMFESSTSLEVHLSYHKENLLTRWATQDNTPDKSGISGSSTSSTGSSLPPSSSDSPLQSPNTSTPIKRELNHRSDNSSVDSNLSSSSQGQGSNLPNFFMNMDHPHPQLPPYLPLYNNNTGDHQIDQYRSTSGSSNSTSGPFSQQPQPPVEGLALPMYENFHPNFHHHLNIPGHPGSNPPPPNPTPPGQGQGQREPSAEILDLDSHKVHVYQHQQQQQGFFHRPYLPHLLPPMPINGQNSPGLQQLNSWPGEQHFQSRFSPAGYPQMDHPNVFYPLQPPPPVTTASQSPGPGPQTYDIIRIDRLENPGYLQQQNQMDIPYPQHPSVTFGHNSPYQQGQGGITMAKSENSSPGSGSGGSSSGGGISGNSAAPMNIPKGQRSPLDAPRAMGRPPNSGSNSNPNPTPQKTKGWKGGECKRPKTYNCPACNKWFTSSGHLKRHYGTTLHKNSMKQQGDMAEELMKPAPKGKKGMNPVALAKAEQRAQKQQLKLQKKNLQNGVNSDHPSAPNPNNANNSISAEKPNPILMYGGPLPPPPGPPGPLQMEIANGNGPDVKPSLPPVTYANLSNLPPISSPSGFYSNPYHHLPQHHQMTQMPQNGTTGPHGPQNGNSNGPNSNYMMDFVPIQQNPHPLNPTDHNHPMFSPSERDPAGPTSGPTPTSGPLPPFSSVGLSHYEAPDPTTSFHNRVTPPYHQNHQQTPSPHLNNSNNSFDSDPRDRETNRNSMNPEVTSPYETGSGSGPRSSSSSGSMETSLDGMLMDSEEDLSGSGSGSPVNPTRGVNSGSGPSVGEVLKCPDCSKTFGRACYLTQHANSSHSGGKPFKCQTCGKRFPEAPALSDHLAKHGSDKPYKCELCPKQFNHKTDLRRHLCLHTGEKPFVCGQCGKGFIRKDHMTKHAETHRKKLINNNNISANANAST